MPMPLGEVSPNVVFPPTNVKRKKYDPVFEITVQVGEDDVIYVGRLLSFAASPQILTVKGVEILPTKKKKMPEEEMLNKLETDEIVEDSFPTYAFKRIRKIA